MYTSAKQHPLNLNGRDFINDLKDLGLHDFDLNKKTE
ncbi:hypothetical protein BCL90_3849 [Pedobacter alluvionis]|uniref:Uncharacterized protein n=1 Tax=Pedobacter alluvionis TaxID=475253 RepID=A0A497XVW4_9SPHI|nr:hypothetical protein BCL90_3849 [Pedobacter alluvionis]